MWASAAPGSCARPQALARRRSVSKLRLDATRLLAVEHPRGWLVTAAMRRRTELWRNETARNRREEAAATLTPSEHEPVPDQDDSLALLLLRCHPALTAASQTALTLRAVVG